MPACPPFIGAGQSAAMSQNVDKLRKQYEAFNRRDWDKAAELLDPDVGCEAGAHLLTPAIMGPLARMLPAAKQLSVIL